MRSNGTGGESGASRLRVWARGAQGEYGNVNGLTALHCAAREGQLEVARLLLESGADVHDKVTVASGYRLLQPPWRRELVTACCSRPSRVGRRPNRTGGESGASRLRVWARAA